MAVFTCAHSYACACTYALVKTNLKFFGDFEVYLEIKSFSERISKIYGNRKF